MPQELSTEWKQMLGARCADVHGTLLHTFGNLTLTGYNAELGNLPFDQKRQKLSASHIDLNRWICDQPQWDEQASEARGVALAHAVTKLWTGPESFS